MNELTQNTIFDNNKSLNLKISKSSNLVKTILLKSLSGVEISENEGTILFKAENIDDKNAIFDTANELCRRVNKEKVTFVVNRNINFTNVCHMGCRFCNFAKRMSVKGYVLKERLTVYPKYVDEKKNFLSSEIRTQISKMETRIAC